MSKQKFKMDSVGYVHAGPTSGKSTVVANLFDQGDLAVETDPLLFGWFMTPNEQKRLRDNGAVPWHLKGDARLQWGFAERAALIVGQKLAMEWDCTLFTSLLADKPPKDFYNVAISFFRKPEALYDAHVRRGEKRDKAKDSSFTLETAKNWYQSWLKGAEGKYTHLILLEDGEFVSDYFDVDTPITDVKEVDRLVYKSTYDLLRKSQWDGLVSLPA